jgi:hypothetical protein
MSPAHVANAPYVFKSQSVEFAKGQTFPCVKGKGEQPEILTERNLGSANKLQKGGDK